MELKNVPSQMTPVNSKGINGDASVTNPQGNPQSKGIGNGPSFEDTLQRLQQTGLTGVAPKANTDGVTQAASVPKAVSDVKFSNHAVERMMSRGISFKPEQMAKINDAIGKAAAKGSKDSLILMDEAALIVSVKNKTVVTVMDKQALKENVFTNIDSTVVL